MTVAIDHPSVTTKSTLNDAVVRQVRHRASLLLAKGFLSFQTTDLKSTMVDQERYSFESISSDCDVLNMHHLANALMSL